MFQTVIYGEHIGSLEIPHKHVYKLTIYMDNFTCINTDITSEMNLSTLNIALDK